MVTETIAAAATLAGVGGAFLFGFKKWLSDLERRIEDRAQRREDALRAEMGEIKAAVRDMCVQHADDRKADEKRREDDRKADEKRREDDRKADEKRREDDQGRRAGRAAHGAPQRPDRRPGPRRLGRGELPWAAPAAVAVPRQGAGCAAAPRDDRHGTAAGGRLWVCVTRSSYKNPHQTLM